MTGIARCLLRLAALRIVAIAGYDFSSRLASYKTQRTLPAIQLRVLDGKAGHDYDDILGFLQSRCFSREWLNFTAVRSV